ncbi:monocarboxylate transporter 9-like [Chelonus insularis]|uniref:monocarboxylate transporter 9-like n=1 Tax=Chelonus insularis TaxID=460826 RepID=UPI00158CBAB1|nr:monocarboxylate transporter 9-like [Chelonus insularis]
MSSDKLNSIDDVNGEKVSYFSGREIHDHVNNEKNDNHLKDTSYKIQNEFLENISDKSLLNSQHKHTILFDCSKYNVNNPATLSSSGIEDNLNLSLNIDTANINSLPSNKNKSEYENDNWLLSSKYEHYLSEDKKIDEDNHFISQSLNVLDMIDDMEINFTSNSDECMKSEKKTGKAPKIPDGGWGWMVVLASLIISMIADGVSFSFGLLYIEFLEEFRASKSKTAWIGSLFMAVPLLSGPIMSALVDKYGCRNMTILGGLISGTGFILSSFGNSIEVMYLTFGILAGVGLGLCYVTAVVSVAYWFDKKRSLAVSLGACGTGIGTFVYAPMTTFFISEYGWRGTCLLLAGTFFNMIVCGTIMRDPEWWIIEQNKQQSVSSPRKSIVRSECGKSCSRISIEDFSKIDELKMLLKSKPTPEYHLHSLKTSVVAPCDNSSMSNEHTYFRSVVNLPTFIRQSEKVPLEVLESLSANSRVYNVILENYPSLVLCRSMSDKKLEELSIRETTNKAGITMSMRIKQAKISNETPPIVTEDFKVTDMIDSIYISKKNINLDKDEVIIDEKLPKRCTKYLSRINSDFVRADSLPWIRRQLHSNTNYFKNIRVHRNSVMYRGAVLNLYKYRLRASSCPNIYRNSMTTLAKECEQKWYTEFVNLLRGMMDFSMFLELHFLLLSLSTILLFTWFIVPYFYLAEHLTRNGYSESDGANLLSIIGITNTIGMIGLGWAGDQPWMNIMKTYTVCLIACGIATILMTVFTHQHVLLAISSALFGLFFASNFSFTPIILVELIPLERFTTAYGLSLLCQGIGNLLGPPLAGLIFDLTGHWDLSFFLAGGWIIVSGLLIAIIPCTKNRKILGSGPIEMDRIGERDLD